MLLVIFYKNCLLFLLVPLFVVGFFSHHYCYLLIRTEVIAEVDCSLRVVSPTLEEAVANPTSDSICLFISSTWKARLFEMKSTRILSRLANRKALLNLSKNLCASTSNGTTSSTIPLSHWSLQVRTLASFKVNLKAPDVNPSSVQHSADVGPSNVLTSEFGEVPVCTTPFHKKILAKILDHAAAHPSRAALIMAENPSRNIKYLELHRQTYAFASFLTHRGVQHMDVVCSVLPNCIEFVPTYLGTMMAGAVSMAADETCTEEELANAFRVSQCKVVITYFKALKRVMAAAKCCSSIEAIVCVTASNHEVIPECIVAWKDTVNSSTADCGNFNYSPNDSAFVQYHSKVPASQNGIVMSHRNISTMLDINTEYFTKQVYKRMFYDNKEGVYEPYEEHAILTMPFHHIFGFAHLNRILLEGSTGVIMTNVEPKHYLETLHKYRPKVVTVLPEMANFLIHHSLVKNYDLTSLEVVLIGGAPFTGKLMDDFLAKFKHVRFMIPFYGWPECGFGFMSPMKRRRGTATILPTFQQKVVCLQTGQALPFDSEGEICLRSNTLMQGYMSSREETSKVIDAEGWFHTGDVGILDSAGETLIVDRSKVIPRFLLFRFLFNVSYFEVASAQENGGNRAETSAEKSQRGL
ncbi:hypothetical protein Y032_0288g1482 [Ancylostoma ceylanicum]|uniref:AMP-dependent synthetase/ligase domain-containing protein n=1 Tax=Ancylostoma ceylanicum TaxID=53326 RepID=A0A016S633_9BILA|nr:hypothetical protein Y032_0288g1482 [Ancylostoma ceylanicum]